MVDDLYFLNQALIEARKAYEEDEVPVGCVIVYNEQIIARAHNKKEQDLDISSHAEINALRKASKVLKTHQLSKCVLYVTLEPCCMCSSAIQQAKIMRVVYGCKDDKFGALGSLFDLYLIPKLNHYPLITYLENKECKEILQEYFIHKRR